jgi:Tol biopolymer transport system component
LERAAIAGGPYAAVALTDDVRESVDCGVVPGAACFYVVRALDLAGNASVPSNEVAAMPIAPRPVLLRPTDAAHPITVRASESGVGGRAWPGAVVAITVNGELRAVGEAGIAYDEVESVTLPEGGFAPRISPEGRTIAFATSEGDATRALWLEWSTGMAAQAEASSYPGAFSPDGRRLTYLVPACEGSACQADVRLVDLDTSEVGTLEHGAIDVHETAWAPSGDRVAVAGWDTSSFGSRLAVIDVATGSMTGLASTSDAFGNLRWSPDGAEIAVQRWDDGEQRLEMDVIPAVGGAALSLPDEVSPVAPDWMPAGRTVVFTSIVDGRPRLRSWDIVSGSVIDLTDGATASMDGRVDATGERLSYVRYGDTTPAQHALVVRDVATGLERVVLEWTSDPGATSEVHEWVAGGYLAFLHEGRVRLFPSFDGAFHVPAVGLSSGSNVVEAEGIEVTTGTVSDASLPATLTVPPEVFPDLAVSPEDLASYPTIPLAGQPSVVSARVRNVGAGMASPSTVRLEVRAPWGTLLDQTIPVGAIAPGASMLVSSQWSPPAAGTYLLRVEVDPGDEVRESREDNNAAARGILVAESAGLSIGIGADLPAYPAHTTALLE